MRLSLQMLPLRGQKGGRGAPPVRPSPLPPFPLSPLPPPRSLRSLSQWAHIRRLCWGVPLGAIPPLRYACGSPFYAPSGIPHAPPPSVSLATLAWSAAWCYPGCGLQGARYARTALDSRCALIKAPFGQRGVALRAPALLIVTFVLQKSRIILNDVKS